MYKRRYIQNKKAEEITEVGDDVEIPLKNRRN